MIEYIDLGRCTYKKGNFVQEKLQKIVESDRSKIFLLFAEFNPVITYTKQSSFEDILVTKDYLKNNNIDLCETNRGGHITCHEPGQLVCYPILNIKYYQIKIVDLLRIIEEIIIKILDKYGILARRDKKYTGVWVSDEKICAIGLHFKNWISSNGFSINNTNNLDLFNYIVPCGIREFGICSLKKLGKNIHMNDLKKEIIYEFSQKFGGIDESKLD